MLSRVASNGYIYGPGFVSTGTAATSGYLRMANAENIAWRNGANSADYTFGLNASDQLVSSAPIWVNSDGAILYGRGGSGQARTVLSYNGSNEYLDLSSNGSVKLRLTSSYGAQFGAYSLTGGTNEKLRVNTPATVDNLANTIITASATTAKALVVQGLASQTANLQEWQDSTGTAIASINGGGVNGASGGILNVGYTGKSYRSFSVTQASRAADNDSYAVATFNATGAGDTYQNLGFNASMTGFNFSGPYGLTVRHSYSSVSAQFRSDGTKFGAGASSVATTPLGQVEIVSAAASTKGVVVRGAASQTANLQEWQSSAGTVLAAINPDGDLEVVDATVNGNLVVDGTATFNGNITVNGHVITGNTSGTTTVTAGAGAGTGASASIAGNDTSGKVTITTGTGSGAGAQATVTFANAYGAAPRVTLTPADGDGASIQYYAGSGTTTFTINSNNAPTDATAYEYYYQIME